MLLIISSEYVMCGLIHQDDELDLLHLDHLTVLVQLAEMPVRAALWNVGHDHIQ